MIAHLILYCLCTATLIGVAAFALEGGLRLFHRPTRGVWAAAVVAAGVIPALSFVTPTVAPRMLERALPGAVLATDRTAELLGEALSPLAGWNDTLTLLWVLGSGLLALVIGVSLVRLIHCRRRWREAVIMGRRVFLSGDVGPAVVGVIQPSIVLPEWALQVDRASQELIVAHEQEHIYAGDHRLLALAAAALVLMPWNLPLWWMVGRLRLAIEIDCCPVTPKFTQSRNTQVYAPGSGHDLVGPPCGAGGGEVEAAGLSRASSSRSR